MAGVHSFDNEFPVIDVQSISNGHGIAEQILSVHTDCGIASFSAIFRFNAQAQRIDQAVWNGDYFGHFDCKFCGDLSSVNVLV